DNQGQVFWPRPTQCYAEQFRLINKTDIQVLLEPLACRFVRTLLQLLADRLELADPRQPQGSFDNLGALEQRDLGVLEVALTLRLVSGSSVRQQLTFGGGHAQDGVSGVLGGHKVPRDAAEEKEQPQPHG